MHTRNKYLANSGNIYTSLLESRDSRLAFSTYLLVQVVDSSKISHVQGGPGNSVCYAFHDPLREFYFQRLSKELS